MATLWQDVRYGLRMLARSPGFAAVVVAILALGIGANTAIFSVVNATLLRPLPYVQSEQLVQVKRDLIKDSKREISDFTPVAQLLAWQRENRAFASLAGYVRAEATLTGGQRAERVQCGRVTAGFFSLLGVQPSLGRAFLPEEDQAGAPPAVVLSHSVWQRCFGADPAAIGRTVLLDERSHTIVGILPAGFQFIESYDVYVPLMLEQIPVHRDEGVAITITYGSSDPAVIGRLKPGIRPVQAQTDLDRVVETTAEPQERGRVLLVSLHEHVVASTRSSLYILLGAVGFVLLIACANVANLLLARVSGRRREMAIRAAMGAGRWRILRQLLIESVLLALLGGVGGLVLTCAAMSLLRAFGAVNLPQFASIRVDRWVLAFTTLVAVAASLVFGLVPAWETSQVRLVESLKEGGRGTTQGRSSQRLRSVLVASEVGLALVLLTGAVLLVKSFLILHGIDPGFRPDRLLALTVHLSPSKYPRLELQAGYFEEALSRLRAVPGIELVAASATPPLSHVVTGEFIQVEGRPAEPPSADSFIPCDMVSPDFFRVLGIPLRSGRFFTEQDRRGAPGVVIINESLSRRCFPNEDPVGRQIKGALGGSDWWTIVGVVGDVHQFGVEQGVWPQLYRSCLQAGFPRMSIVAQTAGDPLRLAAAVRSQVESVDRDQPVFDVQTLEQRLSGQMAPRRAKMILLGTFAVIATVLAAAGIFAVISYTVAQRTHEIGVRMAMGAPGGHILKLVVRQGIVLAAAGVGAGLLASLWLTRYLAGMLYDVKPVDPLTFTTVAVLLIGVAALACMLPAWRAAKVDPMIALRSE
ncbi:MAG: ABC transporter permease [Phycisphaerales bacterium]